MRWTGGAAFVSSLLALTGCSSGQSGESFPVRTVNTGEIRPIPGEAEITSARDLIVVDSTIWVLNGQAPFITRVSLSTGEVQEFGAHGGGPQEFRAPWAIQPVEGRAATGVWIWDLGRREVLTIDALGKWRGASPIPPHGLVQARENIRDVSFVDPFRIRASQEGTIIARYPGPVHRTSDASTGAIWGASIQLEPRTELARFGGSGNRGFGDLREWAAVTLWDACDGTIVMWGPDSSRVSWLDSSGGPRSSVPIDLAPEEVTLEDIEAYLRHMSRLELGPDHGSADISYEAMARSVRNRFADERPLATDIRCQGRETAWLRLFDASDDPVGRGRSWLRISRDGSVIRTVFPDTFEPLLFAPGRVLGVKSMPDGTNRIARWTEALGD